MPHPPTSLLKNGFTSHAASIANITKNNSLFWRYSSYEKNRYCSWSAATKDLKDQKYHTQLSLWITPIALRWLLRFSLGLRFLLLLRLRCCRLLGKAKLGHIGSLIYHKKIVTSIKSKKVLVNIWPSFYHWFDRSNWTSISIQCTFCIPNTEHTILFVLCMSRIINHVVIDPLGIQLLEFIAASLQGRIPGLQFLFESIHQDLRPEIGLIKFWIWRLISTRKSNETSKTLSN